MARILQVKCKVCDSRATITKKTYENSDFSRLYCSCNNPKCNHKFVLNVEYSHSTRTSDLDRNALLRDLVSRLSDVDKDVLRKAL